MSEQQFFDVRAAWRGLSPEQQEAIGAAALIGIIGAAGEYDGRGQAFAVADQEGQRALEEAATEALGPLTDLPRPDLGAIGVTSCRVCGCTDDCACPEGCSWVEPDLCSSCALASAR